MDINCPISPAYCTVYAWSPCMQWGVWVWTVGHWVVMVQVIYCSKGGWVHFLNEPTYPWEEILSYSNRRKPDLPVTHSSPFSTWLSVLLFFFFPHWNHTVRAGLWVLLVAAVKLLSQLPYSIIFCVLYCKHQIVYGISLSYFFMLVWGFGFWMWRLTLARRVMFLLSPEYSVVICGAWQGTLVTWPWFRFSMIFCRALRLWSQICVTCRRWQHTYEIATKHFAKANLSVVVTKW